jgi:hypothetical protein
MDKRGAPSRQKVAGRGDQRELRWGMIDDTIYQMGEQNSQIKLKGEEKTRHHQQDEWWSSATQKRAKENFVLKKRRNEHTSKDEKLKKCQPKKGPRD